MVEEGLSSSVCAAVAVAALSVCPCVWVHMTDRLCLIRAPRRPYVCTRSTTPDARPRPSPPQTHQQPTKQIRRGCAVTPEVKEKFLAEAHYLQLAAEKGEHTSMMFRGMVRACVRGVCRCWFCLG